MNFIPEHIPRLCHAFCSILLLMFSLYQPLSAQELKLSLEKGISVFFGSDISNCPVRKAEFIISDSFNRVKGRFELSDKKITIDRQVNSFHFTCSEPEGYYFSNIPGEIDPVVIRQALMSRESIQIEMKDHEVSMYGDLENSFSQLFIFRACTGVLRNFDELQKHFTVVCEIAFDPDMFSFIDQALLNSGSMSEIFDGRVAILSNLNTSDLAASDFLVTAGLGRKEKSLQQAIEQVMVLFHPSQETEHEYIRQFKLFNRIFFFTVTPDRFLLVATEKKLLYKENHHVEREMALTRDVKKPVSRIAVESHAVNLVLYDLINRVDQENIEIVNQTVPFYQKKTGTHPEQVSDLTNAGIIQVKPFFFLAEKVVFVQAEGIFKIHEKTSFTEFSNRFGLKDGTVFFNLFRGKKGLEFEVQIKLKRI